MNKEKLYSPLTGQNHPGAVRSEDDDKAREIVLSVIREAEGVTLEELKGRSRVRLVVFCRFIAAKELYSRTNMTMIDIADLMERDIKSIRYYLFRYDEDFRYFSNFRQMAEKMRLILDAKA